VIVLWEVEPDDLGTEKRGPVNSVLWLDIKGSTHLAVVRDDSLIELHRLDGFDRPNLQFEMRDPETITGVAAGNISSTTYTELLFTCYSGAVKSLVQKKQLARMGTLTEDTDKMTKVQVDDEKQKKL
jgi:hypothetical protein